MSSLYDKEKKRPRKISGKYIGMETESGIIKKTQRNIRSVFEWRNLKNICCILRDIEAPLRKHFASASEIMAIASVRVMRNVPLKYMDDTDSKLYMCNVIDASLSHLTIPKNLREIGSDLISQHEFFMELISDGNVYLYDPSSIFSYSENTTWFTYSLNRSISHCCSQRTGRYLFH